MKDNKQLLGNALLGVATVVVCEAVKATYNYAKEKQVGQKVKDGLVNLVKKNKDEVSDEEEIL